MRINKFNENKNDIRWTTFNNHDAKEFLNDVFIDFIEPTDDSEKAHIDIKKMGYHTLVFWTINIPIQKRCGIDELSSIINDINGKIKYVEESISKTTHSVSLKDNKIVVSIWSNQD